jgi:hypothetical protein
MLSYRNRVLVASNHSCDSLSFRLFIECIWTPAFWSGEPLVPFFLQEAGQAMCQLYVHKHPASAFVVAFVIPENAVDTIPSYRQAALNLFRAIEGHSINALRRQPDGAPPVFYCWAVNAIVLGQVYVTDPAEAAFGGPDSRASVQKMHELCREMARVYDMAESNQIDGEYMLRSEGVVVAVLREREIEIYAVAKAEDLPDEQLSNELKKLREFVRGHMTELFMADSRFQIEPF